MAGPAGADRLVTATPRCPNRPHSPTVEWCNGPATEWGLHAGKRDTGTRRTRQTGRQIAINSGGRVHSRRDASHPRGQARCELASAGHRHRPLQSAPRRSKACAAETWPLIRKSPQAGPTRLGERPFAQSSHVADPVARDKQRAEAKVPRRRFALHAVASGPQRRTSAGPRISARRRDEGGPHERQIRTPARRTKSRAHQSAAFGLTTPHRTRLLTRNWLSTVK